MSYYRCTDCDTPAWNAEMSFGRCKTCAPKYPTIFDEVSTITPEMMQFLASRPRTTLPIISSDGFFNRRHKVVPFRKKSDHVIAMGGIDHSSGGSGTVNFLLDFFTAARRERKGRTSEADSSPSPKEPTE